jgi:hypothetical protein
MVDQQNPVLPCGSQAYAVLLATGEAKANARAARNATI